MTVAVAPLTVVSRRSGSFGAPKLRSKAEAEIKAKENPGRVEAFIASQSDEQVRSHCHAIIELMSAVIGE